MTSDRWVLRLTCGTTDSRVLSMLLLYLDASPQRDGPAAEVDEMLDGSAER